MPPRKIEILNRLDAMHREETELIAELREILEQEQSVTQEDLVFCNDMRTITWNGGACSLGKTSFKLLCIIWNRKDHKTTFDDIEKIIWKGKFIQSNTIVQLIGRTRKILKNNKFPYILENLKNSESQEIEGLALTNDKKCH